MGGHFPIQVCIMYSVHLDRKKIVCFKYTNMAYQYLVSLIFFGLLNSNHPELRNVKIFTQSKSFRNSSNTYTLLQSLNLGPTIVGKKWDHRILDPLIFSGKIRKNRKS